MKTAFLVLGAQRSGTSVTSHMLSKFAVSFGDPENFLQDNHNPTFFELKWINKYNDRLIKSLGYRYTDFFLPLAQDYDNDKTLEVAAALPSLIEAEWNNHPCIGIKDPRISLTFPIWQQVLSTQGYTLKIILVYRCPSGFLRSNQKLLQNWEKWDSSRHLRFWSQLSLAAIHFTQGFPIHYVSYDDLMSYPTQTAMQLVDCFGLDRDRIPMAASVVDPSYYHHPCLEETGDFWVDHYYKLFCYLLISYLRRII